MTRQTKSARAEVWRERLVRFESSGLSVREFCSHEAVSPSNSRTHPPQPSREMVLLGAHPHIADDNRCGGLQLLGIERCRRPWPGGPLARILRPLRVSALPSLCEGYDALLMLAH